jgi:dipeptidase E
VYPEEGIVERVEQDKIFLKDHGFSAERLDLREYFGTRNLNLLKLKLQSFGLVWVRGGNTFVLRRAMKQSGFDELIIKMLKNDELVYGGFSAGACVVGSTLKGLEEVDNPLEVPEEYFSEVVWEALGLVPYAIAPHFESNHPESDAVSKVISSFKEHNQDFRALRDGEAILIDGDHESLI